MVRFPFSPGKNILMIQGEHITLNSSVGLMKNGTDSLELLSVQNPKGRERLSVLKQARSHGIGSSCVASLSLPRGRT